MFCLNSLSFICIRWAYFAKPLLEIDTFILENSLLFKVRPKVFVIRLVINYCDDPLEEIISSRFFIFDINLLYISYIYLIRNFYPFFNSLNISLIERNYIWFEIFFVFCIMPLCNLLLYFIAELGSFFLKLNIKQCTVATVAYVFFAFFYIWCNI